MRKCPKCDYKNFDKDFECRNCGTQLHSNESTKKHKNISSLPFKINWQVTLVLALGILLLIGTKQKLFDGRKKQIEAKDGLEKIYQAQISYFQTHHCYAETLSYIPPKGKYYVYYIGNQKYFDEYENFDLPIDVPKSFTSAQSFYIIAAANLDKDDYVDIWTIDNRGIAKCLYDDITNQFISDN